VHPVEVIGTKGILHAYSDIFVKDLCAVRVRASTLIRTFYMEWERPMWAATM